jgi:cytochrome c biogenesis protein CcdA
MLIYFLTGVAASSLHVISGPDHLAAVTPLAIEGKNRSWFIGFSWGLGHTIGVFIIGILSILFRNFIPIDLISNYSEQIVGILLIVIGVWIFYRIFFTAKPHHHHHATHSHKTGNDAITALGIGIVHGLAGVSHLIGILPSLALPTKLDAVSYILGFGAGTIFTMVLYAAIMGAISSRVASSNRNKLLLAIRIAGSSAAVIVGIFWIYQSGAH